MIYIESDGEILNNMPGVSVVAGAAFLGCNQISCSLCNTDYLTNAIQSSTFSALRFYYSLSYIYVYYECLEIESKPKRDLFSQQFFLVLRKS